MTTFASRYVVVYEFRAENLGELSVAPGDVVGLGSRTDAAATDGWRHVRHAGAEGFVPASHLSPLGLRPCSVDALLEITTPPRATKRSAVLLAGADEPPLAVLTAAAPRPRRPGA